MVSDSQQFSFKGASINCHSEHREESLFASESIIEMFRFAQHDIFRNYFNDSEGSQIL